MTQGLSTAEKPLKHHLVWRFIMPLTFFLTACQSAPPDAGTLQPLPPPPSADENLAQTNTIVDISTAETEVQALPTQSDDVDKTSTEQAVIETPLTEPAELSAERYEEELSEQQKRIDLGLEREHRAQEPVDNVLHVEF